MTQLADIELMEELHRREDNGIAVSLVWSRYSGRLSVVVEDRKVGASFTLDARADNALEVFYHPYAQATPIWTSRREATPDRSDGGERHD